MNKTELVAQVAAEVGMTQKDTELVIRTVLQTVTKKLAKGEKIALSGFGTFEVREKAARIGKNPRTKQTIKIPASRSAVFKPSKNLKEAVAK